MRWLTNRLRRLLEPLRAARTQTSGAWAEALAAEHLRRRGLRLLASNYRSRRGECDLLMQDRDTLVFVEVRYRASQAYGGGLASIDRRKQRRILACAGAYLARHPQTSRQACRFDVVVIGGSRAAPEIEWLADAFRP